MASAQMQQQQQQQQQHQHYNNATSNTTTTTTGKLCAKCKGNQSCHSATTTLLTSSQHSETNKITTTTTTITATTSTATKSTQGISVVGRKQFARHSASKTDSNGTHKNEILHSNNKELRATSTQAQRTTTTKPATTATTETTATSLPRDICDAYQVNDSEQRKTVSTEKESNTKSVPATTATTARTARTTTTARTARTARTASCWSGEVKKSSAFIKSDVKWLQGGAAAAAATTVDVARSGFEIKTNSHQPATSGRQRNARHEMLATAAVEMVGNAGEMLQTSCVAGGGGSAINSNAKRKAAFVERALVAETRGGSAERDSVNIEIASRCPSECCGGGSHRDACNRIFTGIFQRHIEHQAAVSCSNHAAHNNKKATPTCCRRVYAVEMLQQVENATCNNFESSNGFSRETKLFTETNVKLHQTQHKQQQQQQQQHSRGSFLSCIISAATFFCRQQSNQISNNLFIRGVQHAAATLMPLSTQYARQRNYFYANYNHNSSNNNNNNSNSNSKLNSKELGKRRTKVATNTASNISANFATFTAVRARPLSGFSDFQRLASATFSLLIIFHMLPLFCAECDQTFVSRINGPQNGTFSAPLLHNPKNYSRQCLYTFLAGPGQRVEVVFTSFNLRGSPPDGSAVGEIPSCVHEYMDVYSEIQSSDPAELINSPFGGRYCGSIPPRRRISLYRAIAISFFTNKNVTAPDLFEGRYKFINASEYEIGIPIAGSPCSYTITPSMSVNKTGVLISPTYPGAYPKDMSCTYQFLGESNQRVRLEFRDFDLFFGGPHCPFDYVKVYDGPDNSSALIGTYCGQQRNLVLYSSESSLFVHFYTLPRTANTQNRGFKGIYEFSESFVKLDFIRENDGIHIRGSECDQKILSRKESTGVVLSPNYPYPYIPKTVCRYFIYGMQDAQHLERVRLEFTAFNIPRVENKDKSETNCSDGYLKVYLKGQETADAYDKFDYELCGNETTRVVSDGPRLAMVFSSGELQGRGFKGKYTFETEYKIPGTAAPDGTCSFTYVSSSKKRGDFNSPRYPSNYPSSTNCSYLFLAEPNEQVTIVFDHFKVKTEGSANATAGAYGAGACFEDWLEMYFVYRDNNDRFLGRYCGLTAPGPVESPRGSVGLRITLHTDQENVASGFKARYFFETSKSEGSECGGNFTNEDSGIIMSPNYPAQYKPADKSAPREMSCNWIMTARPGYKLSINFEHFSLEGDPAGRGCPAAVLRLWVNVDSDQPPLELCGEKPPIEQWYYISTGQTARISFTTSDKTVGAPGFRIVWTEIQDSGPGPPSIGLLCESTYHFQCEVGYCISDKLRCNGVKNCGPGDDSDELHCITEAPEEDHGVLIIITLVVVSFLICLLCTLYHSKRKRRHNTRQLSGLRRNAAHYDSTTSATGLSSSRRHLQTGGSISGSLHGINSGSLIIPPAPLPPTSVPPPPHICIAGVAGAGIGSGMLLNAVGDDVIFDDTDDVNNDDDNDEDEQGQQHHHHQHHHRDIFINDMRFDEANMEQLNHLENV